MKQSPLARTQNFLERAAEAHGDKYSYDQVIYVNNHTKVKIFCKACDAYFMQTPMSHLTTGGCKTCGVKVRVAASTFSTKDFIEKSIAIHGDKYNYDLVDYVNYKTKVIIKCIKHNLKFEITPLHHISGCGCYKCGTEAAADKRRHSNKDFIEMAIGIYGDAHDYSKVDYINNRTKIIIFCKIHSVEFEKIPHKYLSGQGCPMCSQNSFHEKMALTTNEFIEKAIAKHGDRYDYSKVEYKDNRTHIPIRCKIHDSEFFQTPNNHLNGKGCSICFWNVSKQEIEWLNSFGKELERQRAIKVDGTNFKVDGYDPTENVAYEFFGDYWHGNPEVFPSEDMNETVKETFGSLYEKTLKKVVALKTVCKDVIVMWENDWQQMEEHK